MLRLALLACALALHGAARAQPASPAACPGADELAHVHLIGLWRAEFEGLAQGATLLLGQHPELAESVRGAINRNGERAEVSGDVDDGDVTLEESANGVNISATWWGTMEEGSCGKTIKGTWQGAGDSPARAFVLRKLPDSR
ncbi:hypothetical protein [Caenimonas aquaedulcis]|uniref:DUF2147 domain-containing protein n=1 Tax=Caenimonas aquaedulcis TaxID=2793270 RepID=A0A931H4Y6_9BURK|nr:hypothetical protein [Caenimonas aquaedulcis]MBG9388661.1 hypothetical protein [Caenimonas aquaedulcis]